jgi:GTP-binding protein
MTQEVPSAPRRVRKLPILAIVGRPNVGKSTLFNRLVGERKAIVDDTPGVTRDRNYGLGDWGGRKFQILDTGGLDSNRESRLEASVQEQSLRAIDEADAILFLLDGKSGLNPLDREAVDLLRRADKPIFFAVNKVDSRQRQDNLYEFYSLGLDRLFAISAEHGLGLGELLDEITAVFPDMPGSTDELESDESMALRMAVVGRPNAGKSTLINRLLGYERSVVDALPGTTRDALDTPYDFLGQSCTLIDTAGIRRKARIDGRVERFSVQRALRTVDGGNLIIHVIDGIEGVTDQDAQILSYAGQRGKALLLAVNKWDLASKMGNIEDYREQVYHNLSFLDYVPVIFISAATGYGIPKLLETARQIHNAYQRKIQTSVVNQTLQLIVRAHAAPLSHGKAVKFYYGTQTGTRPPTFTFFVNSPAAVPESYRRYLVHHLRERLRLDYAPIRLILRARRDEPISRRPRRRPRTPTHRRKKQR